MKHSITIRQPRVLLTILLGLLVTLSQPACSVVDWIFSKKTCTCHCACEGDAADHCGSSDPGQSSGTQACEEDCLAKGSRSRMCHDSSDHVVNQDAGAPPPICPNEETYRMYAFCDSCTSEQIDGAGCTQDEALKSAQMRFPESDPNCMLAICMGT